MMQETWRGLLFGAAELERGPAGGVIAHRIPATGRRQIQDALFSWVESCAAGVRLRLLTDAPEVELTVASTIVASPEEPPTRPAFVVRQGTHRELIPLPEPTVVLVGADRQIDSLRPSPPGTVRIPVRGAAALEVRLPHDARVELISISASAPLHPAAPEGPHWVHYGSSISQGLNADAADRTWPATAAEALGWQLRDLSLAGNAQLDGCAARVIRDATADIITLKVGINLLNADSMRERVFHSALHAFLDTVREGHLATPIVLISAVACPAHEHAPGPTATGADGMALAALRRIEPDTGALTLQRTREIIAEAITIREDPHLHGMDGRMLLGPEDVQLLYDGLHPDQQGLDLIAARFAEIVPRPL